ncbi:MAG TPA: hypothetical protein VHC22_33035 [Pirellulales bacterium]|nr:hypothetical protein [Pirellulales bacterium]
MGLPASVLVVSDNQIVAARLRTALLRLGLDCPHSKIVSPETALKVVAESTPDLLFVAMADAARVEKAVGQLRTAAPSTIVAVGVPASPSEVLAAIRAGADDYLSDSDDLTGELEGLVERLRSKPTPEGTSAFTIAVGSAVGGSGGSTVAANLAAEIAKRHERCLLLDLRGPVSDQTLLFNLEPRHSLIELCQHGLELDDATFAQLLVRHDCGVELLPAYGTSGDERRPPVDLLPRIVQLAQSRSPYVVVDHDVNENDAHLRIAQASNVIALVTRLDVVALLKTKQAVNHLTSAGILDEQIVLIANRCGQPSEISIKLAEKSIERRIEHRLPDDAKTVNACVNVGRPAVLEMPSAKVSKGFKQVCDALLSGPQHHQRPAHADLAASAAGN